MDERECDLLRVGRQLLADCFFGSIIENRHRHDDRKDVFVLQLMVEMFPGFVDSLDGVEREVGCGRFGSCTTGSVHESNFRSSPEQFGCDGATEAAGRAVADIAHRVNRCPSRTGGDENMTAG